MQNNSVGIFYGLSTFTSCDVSRVSCCSYIIELVFAGAILVWVCFEFGKQIKISTRLQFSWQQILLLQIFLTLVFHICFLIWASILLWFILEFFLFRIYFTTIVYYVLKKYLEKTIRFQQRKRYWIALLGAYIFFCLLSLGIFIYSVNSGTAECKQLSEIILSAIMIILSFIVFYVVYKNQEAEKRKFIEFGVALSSAINLRSIWIWIFLNIIGQICSLVEAILLYSFYQGTKCYIVESNVQNDILNPLFMILIYGPSFCSTLWFYRKRRQRKQEASLFEVVEMSAQMDYDNRIELIRVSTVQASSNPSNYFAKTLE